MSEEVKEQLEYYLNAVNFLINNGFLKQENILNLFCLQLTPKGVDSAKKAIENEWERENKLSQRSYRIMNAVMTSLIVIATVVNVIIALSGNRTANRSELKESVHTQENPIIEVDSTEISNDSTHYK